MNIKSFSELTVFVCVLLYLYLYSFDVSGLVEGTLLFRLSILSLLLLFLGSKILFGIRIPLVMRSIYVTFTTYTLGLCFLIFAQDKFDWSTMQSVFYPWLIFSCSILFLENVYSKNYYSFLIIISIFVFALNFIWVKFNSGFDVYGFGANLIYYLLFALPFLVFIDSTIMRRLCFYLTFVLIFISLKRTAIIACSGFIFFAFYLNSTKYFTRLSGYLYAFVFIFSGYFLLDYLSSLGFSFDLRFDGDANDFSSGRLDIYGDIVSSLFDFNMFDLFIGRGFLSSTNLESGLSAHNDFLEIFYSFGLIGFLLYFSFIVGLLVFSFKVFIINKRIGRLYFGSLFIFLTVSLFSSLIFAPSYIGLFFIFTSLVYKKASME